MPISAQSRIHQVSIYARGAVVTRSVEVPSDLPGGEVDLLVGDITSLCDPGSVRAELKGAREVISLQASLHVPSAKARAGASLEKVQELKRRMQRLDSEYRHLDQRRTRLNALALAPRLRMGGRFEPVDERIADALAASSLLSDLTAELDARALQIGEEVEALRHQLAAAELDASQRASQELMGTGHPTRQVTLRLGAGGAVESLRLSYQVPAARWWPVYTLRLSDGGKQAAWWLEALVAQVSGEDWKGVALSLSTADLIHDARLPELPSLRLGRVQAPAKKAYRPPPPGLDRMFEAYDRAFAPPPPEAKPEPDTRTRTGAIMNQPSPVLPPSPPPAMQEAPAEMYRSAPKKSRSLIGGLFPGGGGGMAAPAPAAAPMPTMQKTMSLSLGASYDEEGEAPVEEPAAIEPADSWLDFDALMMSGLGEKSRGRLRMAAPRRDDGAGAATARLDGLAPPKARDPATTRGLFDHRYDADGQADVPSDALPHRVTVGVAEAPSSLFWRTVPREAAEVYKEARLKNPFKSPLLAGPVDVYVEGSLLLVSEIERIDVGGDLTVGLGVEDRIRVARNARVEEGSAGLLGGSVVVDHEVSIELSSSLGREAQVEVADRLPSTLEDDLEIALVSSKPQHGDYDQKERGSPIKSGLRWTVPLAPSGKGKIVFRYKLTFPSKNEIAGGNRRE